MVEEKLNYKKIIIRDIDEMYYHDYKLYEQYTLLHRLITFVHFLNFKINVDKEG